MTLRERHAANLKAAREHRGLSPEELSRLAWPNVKARGAGGTRIRQVEKCARPLSPEYADDIARALGLDVAFFGAQPK